MFGSNYRFDPNSVYRILAPAPTYNAGELKRLRASKVLQICDAGQDFLFYILIESRHRNTVVISKLPEAIDV